VPDDLYGPLRPSAWWAVLAVALVVLVIAWFAWVLWSTRRRRPGRRTVADRPPATPAEHRARTLAAIDELEAACADGRLDARELFQRLSPLVRRYVYETSGRPAHVRSLEDLRDDDPELAATVEWLYPEEFAADAPGAVDEGLARARWYVTTFPGPTDPSPPPSPPSLPARLGPRP
jgi:hypothetical protein